MNIKLAALLAILAVTVTLPLAACGNSEGFRRDDSSLDLDSSSKVDEDLLKVEDEPERKPGEPLPEQKNYDVAEISTDLSKKPSIPKAEGDAPEDLQASDVVTGSGAVAKSGDEVEVNYVGVLFSNGKEFDSSWKRDEPFSFTLGQGGVIQGWDDGVVGMKVGGRRLLVIPADQAYGAQGQPPTIPPDAPLTFVVDLKKIK